VEGQLTDDRGLTERVVRRLRSNFAAPAEIDAILERLAALDPPLYDLQDRERLMAAIALLGHDRHGLETAVSLSLVDWRDVLVAAGLGDVDWPARLTDLLGPRTP